MTGTEEYHCGSGHLPGLGSACRQSSIRAFRKHIEPRAWRVSSQDGGSTAFRNRCPSAHQQRNHTPTLWVFLLPHPRPERNEEFGGELGTSKENWAGRSPARAQPRISRQLLPSAGGKEHLHMVVTGSPRATSSCWALPSRTLSH